MNRGFRPKVRTLDWMSVLDVDGPFLAAPVVQEVFPAGLPALDGDSVRALREFSSSLDANVGNREPFVHYVLRDFLGWGTDYREGPGLPTGWDVPVPEHRSIVRPTFALSAGVGWTGDKPMLLGMVLPPGTRPTSRRPGGDTWTATPADRLAHLVRHHKVPLGLVTDGNDWTLVAVTDAGPTSYVTWTRHTWLDEPDTLKAFYALLGRQRFFGVADAQRLPAMLADSLRRQEELTDRLSGQAHAAVEMLVATLGRADAEHRERTGAALLPDDVEPADVYAASVTILMRLLFLLYAEERDLLPLDDDTYATHYAVTTLVGQLRQDADERGEATLERSTAAWHRLLALFRGLHRGTRHHVLNLNAYGGSLFDPDRFPWLEGRTGSPDVTGEVPPIDDRTILRALEALTKVRVPGEPELRTVSFAVLDVEQIGYVYEGLLDQDAVRAESWTCGIVGDSKGLKDGPEVPLGELQAQLNRGVEPFATWLAARIKESGGGLNAAAIVKRLAPIDGDDAVEAERLVRPVCAGNQSVIEQVLPFTRLLRLDPRDLPVVYAPGSLYLTESTLRASTGAVYTPRALAEQVVIGALEPLVYSPGPLDSEDQGSWTLIKPDDLLALRVIDIAAGSGAFLVSATRYLADRLLESWAQYDPDHANLRLELEPQRLAAIRAVLDHCIYGVDINPLALEMAKLSLWLISLDKTRPFGFLDDRLAVGDSLLGVTSPEQIRDLHMDPSKGRALHHEDGAFRIYTFDTDTLLKEAAAVRHRIAGIELTDTRAGDQKARLLVNAQNITDRLTIIADALSAASLGGGSNGEYSTVASLVERATVQADSTAAEAWDVLADHARFGLTDSRGTPRHPAHFPLLFPEVFTTGSRFSAVVGNPPFLGGQKLTGTFGVNYREHLVNVLGRGARGSADLVAYMVLRATDLLDPDLGQTGLIATNTLTQGDTREVGLDQLTREGLDIRAAVKSEKWPTHGANLEYSILWGSRRQRASGVRAVADGTPVAMITSSLDPAGRVTGKPHRLAANSGIAFIGCYVLGLGFVLSSEDATMMIDAHERNRDVIFPYVNGDDVNSRPDSSGSRWVIDFNDWSQERAETYAEPWQRVESLVRPERQRRRPDGEYALRSPMPQRYWQYAEKRPALRRAIAGLDRVIVIALTSSVVQPVFLGTGQVFDQVLVVFASDDAALYAAIASSFQYWWVVKHGGTLETRLRFTPSDVFQTLPLPALTARLRSAGQSLHDHRSAVMLERNLGLTKLYNQLHDPAATEADIDRLRELHREIDQAMCQAYGWLDLDLIHGHYETRQGIRYTISPASQLDLLDRLLELNLERAAEEQSVHADAGPSGSAPVRRSRDIGEFGQVDMFAEGDA